MNNIQTFNNPEFGEIRTIQKDGEPWFVLKDVCEVLGIADHKVTSRRLDEDEVCQTPLTDSLGRQQETTIINESGLYSVILRSDKPNAKPFRKWVTQEVLPSVRKNGSYLTGTNEYTVTMNSTETHIEAAKIMATCLDGNRTYVLNILRHIVPDIDEAQTVPVVVGDTAIEMPAIQNSELVVSRRSTGGYTAPFRNDRLEDLISKHGITNRMLEKAINAPKGTARRWVSGANRPSRENRNLLCEFFGVRGDYFDDWKTGLRSK